ncbi:MAG: hypothetical protein WA786_05695 [Acidimicrobiales bacterium]
MRPTDAAPFEDPPSDPEAWSDEQWIAWLVATDAAALEAVPASVAERIVRSSAGQMLGQAMLGLAQVFYGPKEEEVIIVAEGNSDPYDDEPFAVRLDPDHPEHSTIVFRSP